ncbi:MAG: hypothetical protein C4525_07430 [Desulfarculus sp.]|nr:MAG: hypothetical protein C4525_07430 [Desulfarculus sp.]
MVALVGGLIALLLGIIGLFSWWKEFLWLLKGVIPPILILGGLLATYLGAEEMKDKRRAESEAAMEPFAPAAEDADRYKQEVADLKAKLAAMEQTDKTKPAGEA